MASPHSLHEVKQKIKQKALTRIVLVVALFFICVSAIMSFSNYVQREYTNGTLRPTYHSAKNRAVVLFSGSVEPWMTFDYINTVFNIPSFYLKQAFNISDGRYPNIQIARYAKERGIEKNEFANAISNAITTYSRGQ